MVYLFVLRLNYTVTEKKKGQVSKKASKTRAFTYLPKRASKERFICLFAPQGKKVKTQ